MTVPKEFSLTDVCDFQGGTQPPKDEWLKEPKSGYIRMLQIRDFTQGKSEHIGYVKDSKKLNKCASDDILIGRYGASVGKILTGLEGAYNVAIIKTVPNKELLTKRFLYYILVSPPFQNFILNIGARAAQAGFNKSDLSDFRLVLPSVQDQLRIANILSKAESLISQRKESLRLLDELLKSTFLEMFGDPVRNEKEWNLVPFEDLTLRITKGESPKWQGFGYLDEGVRFVTSENVHSGHVDLKKAKYIHQDFHNKLKRSQLLEGDLLVNLVGASVGRPAIVQKEALPANINQAVATITLKPGAIDRVFLLFLFLNASFQRFLLGNVVEAARANLSLGDFRNLKIISPPQNIQTQFANIVEKTEALKVHYQASLQELENLYGALSQRAFRGELETSIDSINQL